MTRVGLRVLVVEDEAMVSMWIEDTLALMGCEVVATASRLDAAMDKARTTTPDVALLDVNLAGQVSYPVAELLRARGIPFVFATGYGTSGRPAGLENALVLTKPFQMEQLAEALRAVRG